MYTHKQYTLVSTDRGVRVHVAKKRATYKKKKEKIKKKGRERPKRVKV